MTQDFKALNEVPLKVSVLLGEITMTVAEVLKFTQGTIVELPTKVGEPINICVNNKVIAKGEIVIVGEKIAITLTEIAE